MNECCNNNITIKSFEYNYHLLEKDNYLSEFLTKTDKLKVRHNLGLTIIDETGEEPIEKINPTLLDSGFTSEVLDTYVETDKNEKLADKITQKIYELVGEETVEEDDKTLKQRVLFSYEKAKLVDGIQNIVNVSVPELNTKVINIENNIEELNELKNLQTEVNFIDRIKRDYYREEEDGDFTPIAPTTPIPEQSSDSIDLEDLAHIFLSGESDGDDSSIIPVNVDIATDEDIDNFFTDL